MNEAVLPFYDTHFHAINLHHREPELLTKLSNALKDGSLTQCIDVGINPGDQVERLPLLRELGIAWFTLGVYPSHAADPQLPSVLAELTEQVHQTLKPADRLLESATQPHLVAIGEIGIDQFHDYAPVGLQQELLRYQIGLANSYHLPVVIHNREADQPILETIRANPPLAGGILHCFSSSWETAVQLIDFGFRISFAGNLTYRTAENLREVAARLDSSHLLCETDSPYLSPVPFRGKTNWPGQVRQVYECLAQIRKQPLPELCHQIATNLGNLLRFKDCQAARGSPW